MKKLSLLLAAAFLLSALWSCDIETRYSRTYTDVFDTVSELTAYCASESVFEDAASAVHEELLRLHRLFDIYHTYEGISNAKTVNDAAGIEAVAVDDDLLALIELGKRFYTLSGGKLAISMGSVLSLWHESRENGDAPPSAEALSDAAAHRNIEDIRVENGTVFLADARLRLDFGAIAKGYAANAAAKIAEAYGLSDFVLNLGGNIVARGEKPSGAWKIGIENPDGGLLTAVSARNLSVVTSGDYQRYVEWDGVRYHHIIDPETLYPASRFRAVTVLCADSAVADALSTALFCMTWEDGVALCRELGASALWVLQDGTVLQTEDFSEYETSISS